MTTHSTYNINFDILTTTTFTLTIYVNDGKKQVSETFTATVTGVNEAPYFLASEYIVTQLEANVSINTGLQKKVLRFRLSVYHHFLTQSVIKFSDSISIACVIACTSFRA